MAARKKKVEEEFEDEFEDEFEEEEPGEPVPLSDRRIDLLVVTLFAVCLAGALLVDVETLLVADPIGAAADPSALSWPPAAWLERLHAYATTYDPLMLARPVWYKAVAAWKVLAGVPFYIAAIPAWLLGRESIRPAGLLWAWLMLALTSIVATEQLFGVHAVPDSRVALLAHLPVAACAVLVLIRTLRDPYPFTYEEGEWDEDEEWEEDEEEGDEEMAWEE